MMLENVVDMMPNGVYLVCGSQQTGKTITVMRMCELLRNKGREINYYFAGDAVKLYDDGLPSWFHVVNSPNSCELKEGAVLVCDEAARYLSARNYKKGTSAELLAVETSTTEQRKQIKFVLIQNLASLDKEMMRYGCKHIIKYLDGDARATVRDIHEYFAFIADQFDYYHASGFEKAELAYINLGDWHGWVYCDLPTFFNPMLSRLWRSAPADMGTSGEKVLKLVEELMSCGIDVDIKDSLKKYIRRVKK